MTTSIALSITHAPWIPARVAPMSRIVAALAWEGPEAADAGFKYVHIESTPGPNWKWGEAQWAWAVGSGAEACLFLQDDNLLPGCVREGRGPIESPGTFWRYLQAILAAVGPERVLGFHTRHPEAGALAAAGRRWVSTTELVGTGYLFPRAELVSFLAWRKHVGANIVRQIDEDTSIGVWARATRRRIWHPIPTIVDHDIDLQSTADNDAMPDRRPTVLWDDPEWAGADMASPEFWRVGLEDAPHFVIHDRHLTVNV